MSGPGPGMGGPPGMNMGHMNMGMNGMNMGPMGSMGNMNSMSGPMGGMGGPMGPMGPACTVYGSGSAPGPKPMPPVSAGKIYPPDQPMVFNPQNPNAPPIYPCGICHKEVHDNDQAILCESGCNFWFHRQDMRDHVQKPHATGHLYTPLFLAGSALDSLRQLTTY